MPSQREIDLAAIESLTFPAGWELGQVHEQRRYERTWWKRIERNGKPDLVGIFLSAQLRGGVEVQGYGVTIRCCAEDVQDAVGHVLAWSDRKVLHTCDRCGAVTTAGLDRTYQHEFTADYLNGDPKNHYRTYCGGTFVRGGDASKVDGIPCVVGDGQVRIGSLKSMGRSDFVEAVLAAQPVTRS